MWIQINFIILQNKNQIIKILNKTIETKLSQLFENQIKEKVEKIVSLPLSGSDRKYFRITGKTKTVLGVSNHDQKENLAFLSFTKHFITKGLPVPEIYVEDLSENIYLLQDLGDTTLYSFLTEKRKSEEFPSELIEVYKKVIDHLPEFQINAGLDLDYSLCYPRDRFDKQSMMWDLNYFKYYFLKLAGIPFDEQALEDDFQLFTDYLLQADCNYFLYRDFQSRNIMLYKGNPYFIDYQGGRKGALQYDIASLLYDAKADIPQNIRNNLLEYYIETISKYKKINKDEFRQYYYGYVLIRIMQALGTYGFRGFYEKKEHFLQSIPFALDNLKYLLTIISFPVKIPIILEIINKLIHSDKLKQFQKHEGLLKVSISSFSYKKGLPVDYSGNGGGFIFDCRALHNPGKYDEYKQFTGMDQPVIDFLSKEDDVKSFLNNIFSLVDQSVERYLQRNFSNLMVGFGCTGGQHRSVYCAEQLANHLKNKYAINIELTHREQIHK